MGAKKLRDEKSVNLDEFKVYTFEEFGRLFLKVGKKHVERLVRDEKIPQRAIVRVNGKRRITHKGAIEFLRSNSEGDIGL